MECTPEFKTLADYVIPRKNKMYTNGKLLFTLSSGNYWGQGTL